MTGSKDRKDRKDNEYNEDTDDKRLGSEGDGEETRIRNG